MTDLNAARQAFMNASQRAMVVDDDAALQAARDTYIEEVRRTTAERLQRACGDRQSIAAVITQYLNAFACDTIGLSPSTLLGHFYWDIPSVPALAGCDAVEAERVIRIYATVAGERWNPGSPPLPLDHPWYEPPEA